MNKLFNTVIVASALSTGFAYAVEPQASGDCADFADQYQATAAAQERVGQPDTCHRAFQRVAARCRAVHS